MIMRRLESRELMWYSCPCIEGCGKGAGDIASPRTRSYRNKLITDDRQELLTTYTDTKRPKAERQSVALLRVYACIEITACSRAYLSHSYHFDCACPVCSLPPAESLASDARLEEYTSLKNRFSLWQPGTIQGPEALELVQRILDLGEQEGYLSE